MLLLSQTGSELCDSWSARESEDLAAFNFCDPVSMHQCNHMFHHSDIIKHTFNLTWSQSFFFFLNWGQKSTKGKIQFFGPHYAIQQLDGYLLDSV